jgi:hypothetical protein
MFEDSIAIGTSDAMVGTTVGELSALGVLCPKDAVAKWPIAANKIVGRTNDLACIGSGMMGRPDFTPCQSDENRPLHSRSGSPGILNAGEKAV